MWKWLGQSLWPYWEFRLSTLGWICKEGGTNIPSHSRDTWGSPALMHWAVWGWSKEKRAEYLQAIKRNMTGGDQFLWGALFYKRKIPKYPAVAPRTAGLQRPPGLHTVGFHTMWSGVRHFDRSSQTQNLWRENTQEKMMCQHFETLIHVVLFRCVQPGIKEMTCCKPPCVYGTQDLWKQPVFV